MPTALTVYNLDLKTGRKTLSLVPSKMTSEDPGPPSLGHGHTPEGLWPRSTAHCQGLFNYHPPPGGFLPFHFFSQPKTQWS